MAETLPPKKGAGVQSLVGEIGSHMSWGMAQHLKKKKKTHKTCKWITSCSIKLESQYIKNTLNKQK